MNQTRALLFSTVAMTLSFMIWSVFAPIAGQIQELYNLSTLEKSVLIATPVLLGSIMRIPMGILTDRYGGKKVFTLTMLFLTVPTVAAGFADSYIGLLICALFIGMAGTTFAISIAFVSRWYPPERQGFILGIAGLGNLGSAGANFLLPSVYSSLGISWVFFSLAIVIGIMALAFRSFTQDPPKPAEPKTLKQSLSVTKHKSTWFLSVYYFLTFGGFVTFSNYLPTLLKDLFRMNALEAGMGTAGFVLAATLIRPAGGSLADRFGSKRVLNVVFLGILAIAIVLSATLESLPVFLALCVLLAFLLGLGNGAVFKLVPEVSSGNTGAVTGFVGAAGGIGGFFPPIVLGMVKDTTSHYNLAFAFMVIFALICLFLNFSGVKPKQPGVRKKLEYSA
ncbi:MFS transporter [Cohnella thailandensis]|uniref:NarK/NasA family nitrate transporter n=1 Tax=Cohnella thailandensis TaxID=557557 RepID=A0A841T1U7_9BACL|nr:nitrate/nitrite transporter [Cohnella thailandensis]MBB6636826.1 NarK/NasA family nitrate transporter [Cohnella thailandensis]MBP1973297.1 NNP family nitrate/nitrite transporter-like MFS transporter [Cohnella thailandensis]